MAKVEDPLSRYLRRFSDQRDQFAVPEGSTLAGAARTDDPPAVPMSGGQGPAGAAKQQASTGAAGDGSSCPVAGSRV